jgi:imidazolonepropionase-like amidohydrolase
MRRQRTLWMVLLLTILSLSALAALPAETGVILIKAEKIYTGTGAVITDGMILIKDGKITEMGADIAVPPEADILEARVVIPGLIDIHTHLGVYSLPMVEENSDGNEMTNPSTPQVRALDSFNFDDPALKAGLAAGVTTIVSRPGSGNVIGGTSVAVKLKDAPPGEMILKEICDLKMAIEGNPVGVYGARNQLPSTLMGVYHVARKAFLEAREYQRDWEEYLEKKKKDKEAEAPNRDLGKDALVMALKGEIPVHIHCATASEIASCIRLADEFDLKLSLGHCYWAYLIVDELAKRRDVHYNIGPPMFFNYYQNPLSFKNNAAILSNAGLKVSLQTDALGGGQQNLRHLAALCVRYGMEEGEALKSVTSHAAEAVELQDRIGSIEAGKDADLVLLDGEPFELLTGVEKVLIDGRIEFSRDATGSAPSPGPVILPADGSQVPEKLEIPEILTKAGGYALRGGTFYTMSGAPVTGGTILVKDGKIQDIGQGLAVPDGWPVINTSGFLVLPGLISPRSYIGIASNWRRQSSIDEISSPIVPEMEVKHAIEPQAPHFSFARELGITTALVTPGNRNVMGGLGTVIKTEGQIVDGMVVRDRAVSVFGLGVPAKRSGSMPSTRMGIAALLRETLTKAREYRDRKAKEKGGEETMDLAMEALIPVIEGKTPVMIHCERRDDILTALRIADEFGLKVILDGATDAYRVMDEIKKRNIPVIVEDLFRGLGNIEDLGFNPRTPALLAEAGILVAFRPQEGSWAVPGAGESGGDLLEIAAFAVRNGMAVEEALKAVTINAARIIGLEDRVGSLEKGKDADLVILRGHPFRIKSVPEAVFIEGKPVYRRSDISRLD